MKTWLSIALLVLATTARAADLPVSPLAQDDRRDVVIEGVAHHDGRIFVSAVAAKTVFHVEAGKLVPFLAPSPQTGAIFGLAVDAPRGVLWAAESWGETLPGGSGPKHTGLLKVSLADGRVIARYPAPAAVMFGDVVVDPAGAVYASDGATGAVWVLPPGDTTPRLVGKPKGATSAQGMILCPLDVMVVSDYATGLHRLDLGDGSSRPLKVLPGVLKVAGIDGMVLMGGRTALDVAATYNGAPPYRLMRLKISADCERLEAADTLLKGDAVPDVALAAKAPGGLVVVTNSQWGGWEEDGRRKTTDPGAATVALVKLAPIYR